MSSPSEVSGYLYGYCVAHCYNNQKLDMPIDFISIAYNGGTQLYYINNWNYEDVKEPTQTELEAITLSDAQIALQKYLDLKNSSAPKVFTSTELSWITSLDKPVIVYDSTLNKLKVYNINNNTFELI